MVNLFRQIGIKHIRTIMGKAQPEFYDPTDAQIDSFFDFAAAAGVEKVIWSLHLYNAGAATNWSNNRAIAEHIWNTTTAKGTVERNLLDSFAFDNEPDWLRTICCADRHITGYSTPDSTGGYIGMWKAWRQTIASVAPGAKFSGPDTGSKWPCPGEINTSVDGVAFTRRFVTDASSSISMANQHFYGQTRIASFTASQLAEACLSPGWITTNYALVYNDILSGLRMPYRFTECSAFNNEKNPGNQCFATALWALDFYHWWAVRGCAGVDPFARTVQYNSPIYFDGENYIAEPYAYAMKAFSLVNDGSAISADKIKITNPSNINLTAYGVVNRDHLYVTIINKTCDPGRFRTADVTIQPKGFRVGLARYILLASTGGSGSSGGATRSSAYLGGVKILGDQTAWQEKWTPIPSDEGAIRISVQSAAAAILDLIGQKH